MHILVTGAAGRLGSKLVQQLTAQGHTVTGIDIVGEGVLHADIGDFKVTRGLVHEHRPDIILHPAGWTDVDGCAREPEKAIAINGFGTQNVALAAASLNLPMLYISTNEVFDGKRGDPYREYDPTGPVNPYGYSKWVGEQAIQHINPRHYIVRTSWLFAHGGKNFIQAILGGVAAGKDLRVVTDEVANPTYNDDLADALTRLIQTERYGVYHLVNEGSVSRWAFARHVLDRTGNAAVPIEKISIKEWQRASVPPSYAGLVNQAAAHIGIRLRPWQAAVDAFLDKEGLLKA
jgi:dTDP-4-dehydrorhamnose reductase